MGVFQRAPGDTLPTEPPGERESTTVAQLEGQRFNFYVLLLYLMTLWQLEVLRGLFKDYILADGCKINLRHDE
jgi:hypothetical protein